MRKQADRRNGWEQAVASKNTRVERLERIAIAESSKTRATRYMQTNFQGPDGDEYSGKASVGSNTKRLRTDGCKRGAGCSRSSICQVAESIHLSFLQLGFDFALSNLNLQWKQKWQREESKTRPAMYSASSMPHEAQTSTKANQNACTMGASSAALITGSSSSVANATSTHRTTKQQIAELRLEFGGRRDQQCGDAKRP